MVRWFTVAEFCQVTYTMGRFCSNENLEQVVWVPNNCTGNQDWNLEVANSGGVGTNVFEWVFIQRNFVKCCFFPNGRIFNVF
jgi:hypothetical protein